MWSENMATGDFYTQMKVKCVEICGNKMPTRCNRWIFYCRSYCLLNMFRAPLCPSSGALEYYTSSYCLSYLVLGFQVVGTVWSWGLCVRFARKHVEQAIRSAIKKIHLLHLVGILFPHIIDDARSKPHRKLTVLIIAKFKDSRPVGVVEIFRGEAEVCSWLCVAV
jgi:hypothetical protein